MIEGRQTTSPEDRLTGMGLTLPPPSAPAANYIPSRRVGDMLYVAGQVPFIEGRLVLTGKLGGAVTVGQGQDQARIATLNALAAASAAHGSLSGLAVAQLLVFVASTPEFVEQHLVANGASDLPVGVLGEAGQHPRTAIAVPCLPLDAPVEIQVTFFVTDGS